MPQQDKTLVLFTASYPFGTGEVFVEHEISFLANAFSRVIIFPQNSSHSERRVVPANVQVMESKIADSKGMAKLAFSTLLWKEVLIAGFSIRKIWVALNSLKRAHNIFHNIKAAGLAQQPEDYIYYSYWLDDAAIALALLKQEFPNANCVSRAHGWDVYYYRHHPAYLPFRPMLAKFLNGIYVISENGGRYIQDRVKEQDRSKIHISRLGCNDYAGTDFYFEATQKLKVVSCSGTIALKRIHLIIEALALIDNIAIEWLHFGDGPLLPELKARAAKQLGSKQNIAFTFFGHANSAQIFSHYKTATPDIFINVSETEGIPVSIMEALCFSIAAIATAVGGVPEIVSDKNNGYLLPANPTPQQIAAQLSSYYALSDREKKVLKTNARSTWETKYNAAKNYNEFIAAIAG